MRCVRIFPRVMPSTEMNSVTMRPTPSSSLIKRRKDESVTPAIGARTRFGVISTVPIESFAGPVISGKCSTSASDYRSAEGLKRGAVDCVKVDALHQQLLAIRQEGEVIAREDRK